MILLVDAGNSNIVCGLSDGIKVLKTYRFKTLTIKTSDELFILFKTLIEEKFDSVIIYNDRNNSYKKNERNLLYVACTRCQHELFIYN